MQELNNMKCTACRVGAPTVTNEEIRELQPQIPDWRIIEVDGVPRLRRVFKFDNFVDALVFTQRVGEMAEAEDHHPALLTEWGRTTVNWWTHKIKGVHRNDFIAAAKTDGIYKAGGEQQA